jgi:signal transduction histidine kinase/CheY-like chemotaxis protein/HAMP domain-containing protein
MTIGQQMRLALGLFVALVAILGALAWKQTELLWAQTETIYNRPLKVRRAVDKLRIDVLEMRLEFRNLLLASNQQQKQKSVELAAMHQADAERQFSVLEDLYSGPQLHVVEARDAFIAWLAARENNSDIAKTDGIAGAMARVGDEGDIGKVRNRLLQKIQTIDNYSHDKATEAFQIAAQQKKTLSSELVVIIVLVLGLSWVISYSLIRRIKHPLSALTAAAQQFRDGNHAARSMYRSGDEFGKLSDAFNTLAEALESKMRIDRRAADLADIMLRETEARAFFNEVLKALMGYTGSQMGAVYLLNPEKTAFDHFESIGLSEFGRRSFSAALREGEFGPALTTGCLQRVKNIPRESRFTFATVAGDLACGEIITIPLHSRKEVAAILSLATVNNYDEQVLKLVQTVLSTLQARLGGVLAYREVQDLAERLETQNRELEAQKTELTEQASQLSDQNTELEAQKRELDRANRMKSVFLSNMSHELRTPLNSVIALSRVLTRRLANRIPEEEHGYLEVIERNGQNLLALINDILDLSRIEAGRAAVSRDKFALRSLVIELVNMLEPQAKEKEIAVRNLIPEDLPVMVTDLAKCRHILQNLIANAVKFTDSGVVEISALQTSEELEVTVRDTGIGIAPDQLARVFDEFWQADDGTARKHGGTGLGLSIARKYAVLLGGDIAVESALGRGSAFTVRLPLLAPGAPEEGHAGEVGQDAVQAGIPPVAAPAGASLLLVEDNEPAVVQITDMLTSQGYQVRLARSGKEALKALESALPDAMILDLMMPEVDGFQVLQAMRARERTARLPVLVLTAKQVTQEELGLLRGSHIHQLIQKGDVSKQDLLSAVASMFARQTGVTSTPRGKASPQGGNPLVLVVEDSADNMRTARALLGDRYEILEAQDGRAALETARAHQPQLILMDIGLPMMDGFQSLMAIRQDQRLREIPVVAVTASAMKGTREEILARGFDGYVSKPIDQEALYKTLDEVLCRHE